jgi:putative ABC transport system permease protein
MPSPPKTFLRFFRWFCHPDLKRYVEGDLVELYNERLSRSGKRKADLKFILDVLLLFRPGIIRPSKANIHSNHYGMLKSHFTIGWRSLLKNKGYSFINVTGLTAGMTVAILISLWIIDELSFDHAFVHHKNIAQVMVNQYNEGRIYTGQTVASPIEDVLRTTYKDDFTRMALVSWEDNAGVSSGEKSLTAEQLFVQGEFTEMFSLSMIEGNHVH